MCVIIGATKLSYLLRFSSLSVSVFTLKAEIIYWSCGKSSLLHFRLPNTKSRKLLSVERPVGEWCFV